MAEPSKQTGLEQFTVESPDVSLRLDSFLSHKLADLSRTRIQALIEEGHILLNGKQIKASHKLAVGDVVSVQIVLKPVSQLQPADLPLEFVYEDEDLVVVNKPVGMVVHPGAGETGPTLAEVLMAKVKQLSTVSPDRPGIVHRLDKDTSGLIVCAKTDIAHHNLAKQFAQKTNYRQYCALLDGCMQVATESVESMIARDPQMRTRMRSFPVATNLRDQDLPVTGRWARSHFTRQRTFAKRLTFVHVQLETGRTHQIRVHAKDIKLPVWGDLLYHRITELPALFADEAREALSQVTHQLLHAQFLGFTHPSTNEKLAFEAPLPPDFAHVLRLLSPFADPA